MEDYLESLSNKQVEKVFFVLDIVEQFNIVPKKFFKKLEATDDIWEVRVQHGNNIFRLQKEIKIAEQRKKDYFTRRRMI